MALDLLKLVTKYFGGGGEISYLDSARTAADTSAALHQRPLLDALVRGLRCLADKILFAGRKLAGLDAAQTAGFLAERGDGVGQPAADGKHCGVELVWRRRCLRYRDGGYGRKFSWLWSHLF